jgi:hypothetical protein
VARSAAEVKGTVIRYPTALRAITASRIGDLQLLLLLALCLVAPAVMASQIIPAGGKAILHDGFYNLACTDLTVGGVLDIGTGTYVNVHNVTVSSTGTILGSGAIRFSGALTVTGTIQPSVQLIVNPPTNAACPGPPPPVTASEAKRVPTLGNSMLVALAMSLLLLALSRLRGRAALRRRGEGDGASK